VRRLENGDVEVLKPEFHALGCQGLAQMTEWHHVDAKTKLPWLFGMKNGEPFALAGVNRHWRSPDKKSGLDTFAIITTEPNVLVVEKTGHDRMPVIIRRQDISGGLSLAAKNSRPSSVHLIQTK